MARLTVVSDDNGINFADKNKAFDYTEHEETTGSRVWLETLKICEDFGLPRPQPFFCSKKCKTADSNGQRLDWTFSAIRIDLSKFDLSRDAFWQRMKDENIISLMRDRATRDKIHLSVGRAFDIRVDYFVRDQFVYIEYGNADNRSLLLSLPVLLIMGKMHGFSDTRMDELFLDAIRRTFSDSILGEMGEKQEVVGLEEVYNVLDGILAINTDLKKRRKLGLAKRNVLLAGPPGCGKSLLLGSLCAKYWKKTIQFYVREVNDLAQEITLLSVVSSIFDISIIIIVDEVDEIATKREFGHHTFQFLRLMDGVNKLPNVTFLATTNRPDMLDCAMFRPERFDPVLIIAWPDASTRRKMVRKFMGRYRNLNNCGALIDKMVKDTEGWTGAEIRSVIETPVYVSRGELRSYSASRVHQDIKDRSEGVRCNHDRWANIMSQWSRDITDFKAHMAGPEVGRPEVTLSRRPQLKR